MPLEVFLQKLSPICIYDESKKDYFRNQEKLIEILDEAIPQFKNRGTK
jgi:hypothetical protein